MIPMESSNNPNSVNVTKSKLVRVILTWADQCHCSFGTFAHLHNMDRCVLDKDVRIELFDSQSNQGISKSTMQE